MSRHYRIRLCFADDHDPDGHEQELCRVFDNHLGEPDEKDFSPGGGLEVQLSWSGPLDGDCHRLANEVHAILGGSPVVVRIWDLDESPYEDVVSD